MQEKMIIASDRVIHIFNNVHLKHKLVEYNSIVNDNIMERLSMIEKIASRNY